MSTNLKIAVQKSGRLLDGSLQLLRECGIRFDNGKDQLKVKARNFPVELYYLRNSDIPQYVYDGVADITILGENTIIEKEKPLKKYCPWAFQNAGCPWPSLKTALIPGQLLYKGKKLLLLIPIH